MGWDFLLSYCTVSAAAFSALLLPAVGLWQLLLARRQAGEEKAGTVKLARNCLVLALGCAALAVWMILIFRAESAGMYPYEETGRRAIHQSDDSFTVDGVTYEAVRIALPRQTGIPDGWYKKEPVFDYDDSPGGLFGAWNSLLGLNDHLRGNYYTVTNDAGVDMVWANRRYGDFFCPADQHARALAWYEDESHYQWVYAGETVLPAGDELNKLITLLQQAREEQEALNGMGDAELPELGELPGSALHTRLERFSEWPELCQVSLILQSTDGLFYWIDKGFYITWYEGRPYAADVVGAVRAGAEAIWAFTPIPDHLAARLPVE